MSHIFLTIFLKENMFFYNNSHDKKKRCTFGKDIGLSSDYSSLTCSACLHLVETRQNLGQPFFQQELLMRLSRVNALKESPKTAVTLLSG